LNLFILNETWPHHTHALVLHTPITVSYTVGKSLCTTCQLFYCHFVNYFTVLALQTIFHVRQAILNVQTQSIFDNDLCNDSVSKPAPIEPPQDVEKSRTYWHIVRQLVLTWPW